MNFVFENLVQLALHEKNSDTILIPAINGEIAVYTKKTVEKCQIHRLQK